MVLAGFLKLSCQFGGAFSTKFDIEKPTAEKIEIDKPTALTALVLIVPKQLFWVLK